VEQWALLTKRNYSKNYVSHNKLSLINLQIVENDLSTDSLMSKLIDSGAFANGYGGSGRLLEDFGDPKLGELLYSD